MTGHERFHEMLARRSELTAQEEAQLREHLAGCPDCRETAADYDRQTALLRSLPVVDTPPALRAAVLSGARRYRPPAFWRKPSIALTPMAAALLAVAGSLLYLNRPHNTASHSAFGTRAKPTATPVIPVLDQGRSKRTTVPKPGRSAPAHPRRKATATPVSGSPSSGEIALGPPSSAPQAGTAPTQAPSVSNSSRASSGPATGANPPSPRKPTNPTPVGHQPSPSTTESPTGGPGGKKSVPTAQPAAPSPVIPPTSAPTPSMGNPVSPSAPTATPVSPAPPVVATPTPQNPGMATSSQQPTPTPTPTSQAGGVQPPPSPTPP
jgi:hypothetical protein